MIRYVEKNWHDNDGDVHMATSHKPIWAMIVLTDFDALGLPYSEGRQLSQCFVSKNIRKLSPQTCSDVEVLMATCDMCPSIFVWSQSYRISSEALVSCLICSKKCRVTTWPFLSWLQVGLSWWDFTFVCATNVKSSGQWWWSGFSHRCFVEAEYLGIFLWGFVDFRDHPGTPTCKHLAGLWHEFPRCEGHVNLGQRLAALQGDEKKLLATCEKNQWLQVEVQRSP